MNTINYQSEWHIAIRKKEGDKENCSHTYIFLYFTENEKMGFVVLFLGKLANATKMFILRQRKVQA